MKKIVIPVISILAVSGCASIISGSEQAINIDTNPREAGTTCHLQNSRGQWEVTVPNEVAVKRSESDLNITCDSPNMTGKIRKVSNAEGWAAGNLAGRGLGAAVGSAVDAGTGSMFSYGDQVIVPMVPKTAE